MPDPTLTYDALWVRQLAADLTRRGQPAARLLAKAGLDQRSLAAENARVPFEKAATFFELAAAACDDDCLGLRFAQGRDLRDMGLLGYVGLSSPCVEDALKNGVRYRRVFSDAWDADIRNLRQTGRLRWWYRLPPTTELRQHREFSAANIIQAVRKATGREVHPRSVTFRHPRSGNLAEFERFFGCAVRFGEGENTVTFKLADLDLPLLGADSRLLMILKRYCEDVLARHEERPPALLEQVERLIADHLSKGDARVEVIAGELGLSTRTFARRLAALDTSFNAVLENLRGALARRYLTESDLSLSEIAFLLGYSEVSAFATAFKRWTGKTPGQVRRVG